MYDFSGVNWHFDPFFEANTIIGFDKDHFYIGHGENELPAPISKIFPDKPFFKDTSSATYEVLWYWQGQLLTDNPAAGVKISDVAESNAHGDPWARLDRPVPSTGASLWINGAKG
jgi:hypothetical protein